MNIELTLENISELIIAAKPERKKEFIKGIITQYANSQLDEVTRKIKGTKLRSGKTAYMPGVEAGFRTCITIINQTKKEASS